MSLIAFNERIGKHKEITRLETKDKDNVDKIISTVIRKAGSITSKNLRASICGSRKYSHIPKGKFEKRRMTPRRYYRYLKWLKNNKYLSQEKRAKAIQITQKGQQYWSSQESLQFLKNVESPEIMLKIIQSLILRDRKRAYKKIQPIITRVLGGLKGSIEEIFKTTDNIETEKLNPMIHKIDEIYKDQIKKLGYEVIGDWEGLKTKRDAVIEKTNNGFILRRQKTGDIFGAYNSDENRLTIMK